MPNVNLTAPSDYGMQAAEIARQRKLADLLIQQASQAPETYQFGGMGGKMSWTQALAKALQGAVGGYKEYAAGQAQKDLSTRYQQDLADVLSKSSAAMTGTPARPEEVMPEDVAGPPQPAQPAVAANPTRAAALMLQHPVTQAIGQQELSKSMSDLRRQEMLKSILGTGGAAAGGSAPDASAAGGGKFANLPPQVTALLTSGDPELVKLGTTMMEANKGVPQRAGAPVVNPYTGAIIAQPTPAMPPGVQLNVGGPGGNQASMVPGFGQATTDISSIPKPGAPPVQVPMSGGQTAQLSQPEYLGMQRTGQMPPRYQSPTSIAPSVTMGEIMRVKDPAERENMLRAMQIQGSNQQQPQSPTPGGLGVPGLTQSQQDLINQEGQRATSKTSGEGLGQIDSRIRTAGMDANLKINKFNRLAGLLDQVETGKLEPTGYELAAVGRSLGFNLSDKVDNFQAAKSLANEMALELRNPSGGSGMPGNFSDQDRAYLQSIIANVGKTPGANKLLVDGMIKMYQRDREIASLATDFKKTHNGMLTDEFFNQVSNYSDTHPLFPKAKSQQAGPQTGGAGSPSAQDIINEMRRRKLAQ